MLIAIKGVSLRNTLIVLASVFVLASFALNAAFAGTLTATPNPFTLSNTVIDQGQVSFANTVISGGIGPYTGEYSFVSAPNVIGNNKLGSFATGTHPEAVAVNSLGDLVYVANEGGTITVYSVTRASVVNTINLASGSTLLSIGINPSSTKVYAPIYNLNEIQVVNTTTNTVVNTITGTTGPQAIAFNPNGAFAYVSGNNGDFYTIDTTTNAVVNTITGVGSGYEMAVNPAGTLVYVPDGASAMKVIDTSTDTVVNTIVVPGSSDMAYAAFNPQGTKVYAGDFNGGNVITINTTTNTVVNTIYVGGNPAGIAVNPAGTLLYASNNNGNVVAIDTTTNNIINNIVLAGQPGYVAFSPSGNYAYATEYITGIADQIAPAQTQVVQLPSSGALTVEILTPLVGTVELQISGASGSPSTDYNIFGSTIFGTLKLFGYAQDSTTGFAGATGLTGTNTIVTSDTLTINPALTTAPAPTVANGLIDQGQGDIVVANDILPNPLGGTSAVAYNWYYNYDNGGWFSASNGACNTFNGIATAGATVSCVFPTNDLSLSPGNYMFEVKLTDSASTPVTTTSPATSSNVLLNTALGTPTITSPSATKIEYTGSALGSQTTSFNAFESGGTTPYTYNFIAANAITDSVFDFTSQASNSFTDYTLQTATPGNYVVNVIVTDSASTPVSASSTYTSNIMVAGAPTYSTFSPSTSSLDSSQTETYTITVANGFGPFTIELYNITGSKQVGSNVIIASPGGSNTISFVAGATGSFTYQARATDLGASNPFTFFSTQNTITVNAAPATTTTIPVYGTGGSVGNSTTSTTTTTTPTTTTIRQINVTGSHINITINISSGGIQLNLNNSEILLFLNSSHSGPANVVITKLNLGTPVPGPQNLTEISVYNVSVNSTMIPKPHIIAVLTLRYNCSIPSSRITPYMLINGTWTAITPFSVDANTCTVTFSIPVDPAVALFESPAPITTTIAATTAPTTSIVLPSTKTENSLLYAIVIIIVILVIAAVVYWYSRSGKRIHS